MISNPDDEDSTIDCMVLKQFAFFLLGGFTYGGCPQSLDVPCTEGVQVIGNGSWVETHNEDDGAFPWIAMTDVTFEELYGVRDCSRVWKSQKG